MQTAVKNFVRASPLYPIVSRFRARNQIKDWRRRGCPVPPPAAYKHSVLAKYARQFDIKTLIETGTLRGDMVAASTRVFQDIYSIELDETLFQNAKQRFSELTHVKIIKGNSGDVLPILLKTIDRPCLFWLDGHYSGAGTGRGDEDTPVSKELIAILSHECQKHVVLIDDARLFTGIDGYPTLDALENLLASQRSQWVMKTEHDIIQILPSATVQ
jgi:hypothetical protein